MNIRTFDLERIQSLHENYVDYNLTESGFHPLKLKEILTKDQLENLSDLSLGYGQTNGAVSLRKQIASLYNEANEDTVLVTNGSAEANFIVCHTLLEQGDEFIMMVPNYMQMWGVAEELNATPRKWHLREESNWAPDLNELRTLVNDQTKMIAICNPNNPTGYVLSKSEMLEIVAIAKPVNAWIYCDEIYRGSELNYKETASFNGLYDKVIVNGGLSKSYAFPGLRLGWLTGPADIIENAWSYRDYTSISSGIMSQYVGEIVLQPAIRTKILTRNRDLLNENLSAILKWVNNHNDLFSFIAPKAGGMAFMKYNLEINSSELTEWLRETKSVFIIPGDCYGMDGYIRIGIGDEKNHLIEGLNHISDALKERFQITTL